jgi:hypothetical protein
MEEKMYKNKRNDTSPNARSIGVPFSRQFLRDLGDAIRKLRPQRAVIFGSAVRIGLSARDLDLLVLAESFSRFLWQDRPTLLDLPPGPIYDVRLFTPAEFETFYPPTSPLRQSIEYQNIDLEEYYA